MNQEEIRLLLEESLEDSSKELIEKIIEYHDYIQKHEDDWSFLIKKSNILFILLDNDLTVIRLRDSLFKEEFHSDDVIWDEFSYYLQEHVGDSYGVTILLEELGFEVEHC